MHIGRGLVAAQGGKFGAEHTSNPWLIRLALRLLESGAYSDGQCCHLALLIAAKNRGKQNPLFAQILQWHFVNYFYSII